MSQMELDIGPVRLERSGDQYQTHDGRYQVRIENHGHTACHIEDTQGASFRGHCGEARSSIDRCCGLDGAKRLIEEARRR